MAGVALESGMRVGPYEVLNPLGRGGMGDVWRAMDTTLRRDVALKVLPESAANDPARLARFRREAQVLASLNHPHIAAIYGVEDSGQSPALVLEFVDGQTLATRLRRGPLPLTETLRVATQIADALEAAHAQDVVHRDLKPGNVMLRADGTVKVLDFGLAKALAPGDEPVDGRFSTVSLGATVAGLIVGTPAYMSPEQALGEPVDPRTDIWAFGCVLYEMLTGRSAFGASTVTESLAKVLEGRVDLDALPADTPPSIRRLVRRCLTRSLRDRLQHIGDARADIADAQANDRADEAVPVRSAGRARRLAGIGALFVGIAAMTWGYFVTTGEPVAGEFSLPGPVPLTSTGNATLPAVLPNGQEVAYVQTGGTNGDSLRVLQIDTRIDEVIVSPTPGVRISAVTASPDGMWLHYVRSEQRSSDLWRVSVRGGLPKLVLERVAGAIGWNQGGQFAFLRRAGGNVIDDNTLWVANADGTGETELSRLQQSRDGRTFLTSATGPAWSPDGETIAIAGEGFPDGNRTGYVMFVRVSDGKVVKETVFPRPGAGGVWRSDSELLWSGPAAEESSGQFFSLPFPGGTMTKKTSSLDNYGKVSVSKDRKVLVTTRTTIDSEINVVDESGKLLPNVDTSAAEPLVSSFGGVVTWAEERVLYGGLASGRLGLWAVPPTGQADEWKSDAHSPHTTTRDQPIVYVSSPGYSLYRADFDGRNPRLLATDAYWPALTPGGDVVFASGPSRKTGSVTLWRVPLDSSRPARQITTVDSRSPDVSRDGRLAFVGSSLDGRPGVEGRPGGIRICDLSDDCASLQYVTARGLPPNGVFPIRWTRDSRSIAYVNQSDDESGPNIWIQPLPGGEAKRLTNFTDRKRIVSFAYSHDFTRLAILRATTKTDLVLFRE